MGAAAGRGRGRGMVGSLPSTLTVLVVLACAVGFAVASGGPLAPRAAAAAAPAVDGCGPRWVTGWQAAAQPGPADPALWGTAAGGVGATLRMVVRPQVGGTEVRIRLSNAYGSAPLLVGPVTAARSDGGAGVLPGSVRQVAFGGRPSVVIAAGADVLSDPVPVVAEVGRPLAVSLVLPVVPPILTQHTVAMQTSYVSRAGDASSAGAEAFPGRVGSWYVLTGVDVRVPRPVNAVVTIGDSITDGLGSAVDADERWSDALSARLAGAGGAASMAVLNAGIAGNRLLSAAGTGSDPPLARFPRDVGAAAGVTDVVLHVGTNDVAEGRSAPEIVAGLQRFAAMARAAGKRVFLTTVTPSTAGTRGTPPAIAVREAVNAWVRAYGIEHADGVFDFAAAVADPAHPDRLLPAFDSGDGLHLSPAGYRALAAAVDLAGLSGSPCLADPSAASILATVR